MAASNRLSVILLAGGAGTRMRDRYPDIPKALIPCLGRPFLEWVLSYYSRQGQSRFVLALGHLAHVVEEYLAQRPGDGLEIRTVCEPTPQGTGGGARLGWRDTVGDVLVANADSLLLTDLAPAIDLFERPQVDGVLLGLAGTNAGCYGSMRVDDDGRLVAFAEKTPGPGWINAGVYLLKQRMRARLPADVPLSLEYDVFPRWLEQGADLRVWPCDDGPLLDVGTPQALAATESLLRQREGQPAQGVLEA